jgi:hypothetical protein
MCSASSAPSNAAASGVAPRSWPSPWRLVVLMAATGLIGYLQLKPDPSFGSLGFPSYASVRFVNLQDFLNNVVGFGGFMAVVHFCFDGFQRRPLPRVARRAACLAGAIVVLEAVQIFFPARSCDWHDVAAGWLGVVLCSLPWLSRKRTIRANTGN